MDWIIFNEQKPHQPGEYLVYGKPEGSKYYFRLSAYWSGVAWSCYRSSQVVVTHWMELPPEPESKS